jgi:hypothetical protein
MQLVVLIPKLLKEENYCTKFLLDSTRKMLPADDHVLYLVIVDVIADRRLSLNRHLLPLSSLLALHPLDPAPHMTPPPPHCRCCGDPAHHYMK